MSGLHSMEESREVGREAGHRHAIYVNAYGGPDYPDVIGVPGGHQDNAAAFLEGFREGVADVMEADVEGWE